MGVNHYTSDAACDNFSCIIHRHILVDNKTLQNNSRILNGLVDEISSNFKDVNSERKTITSYKKDLAGILQLTGDK
jgi:hypothetical protein